MQKFEQAVFVLMLAMGLLLMREGLSYLSQSEPDTHPYGENRAIVLAGPDGMQKTAQAEFLRQRYGLREIAAGDLTREAARRRNKRFLLRDCAASQREGQCLEALARQRDLPPPVFIEIADRRLGSSAYPAWDVYLIQSYYPDAAVWTLDGTRPPEAISATLQHLLDKAPGR